MDEVHPIEQVLCGWILDLIVENETLKRLVCSMAASVPRERMPEAERAMLGEVLARWS